MSSSAAKMQIRKRCSVGLQLRLHCWQCCFWKRFSGENMSCLGSAVIVLEPLFQRFSLDVSGLQ